MSGDQKQKGGGGNAPKNGINLATGWDGDPSLHGVKTQLKNAMYNCVAIMGAIITVAGVSAGVTYVQKRFFGATDTGPKERTYTIDELNPGVVNAAMQKWNGDQVNFVLKEGAKHATPQLKNSIRSGEFNRFLD